MSPSLRVGEGRAFPGAFELSGWRPSLGMVSRETYSRLDGLWAMDSRQTTTVLLE
jgi:hypothetical protein